MIEIRVNDTPTETAAGTTLAEFIAAWQPTKEDNAAVFAVAVNGEFVPRSLYASTVLNACDALDIVSPVGGG